MGKGEEGCPTFGGGYGVYSIYMVCGRGIGQGCQTLENEWLCNDDACAPSLSTDTTLFTSPSPCTGCAAKSFMMLSI